MKKVLTIIVLFFMFIGIAYADEYSTTFEITNEKGKVEAETGNAGSSLYIKIENFTGFTTNNDGKEGYVLFVNSASTEFDSSLLKVDEYGCSVPAESYNNEDLSKLKTITIPSTEGALPQLLYNNWYIYSGYDYMYIGYRYFNEGKGYCVTSATPLNLNKETSAKIPALDQRYHVFWGVTDTKLDVFPYFPYNERDFLKIETKVGLITDVDLIQSLKSNYSDSLDELLAYAEADTENVILSGTHDTGTYPETGEAKSKIQENKLYYIYNNFKTTNNAELRNLKGVSIAQGEPDTTDGGAYLVNDIDWSIYGEQKESVDPETQPQEANPDTGATLSIIVVGLLLIAAIVMHKLYGKRLIQKI